MRERQPGNAVILEVDKSHRNYPSMRQGHDIATLHRAGAIVKRNYFTGNKHYNLELAFPGSSTADRDQVLLILQERPNAFGRFYEPTAWAVPAISQGDFIEQLKDFYQEKNLLPRFIFDLKYWGFRVDQKVLLNGGGIPQEYDLLVQFPVKDQASEFKPDIILKADVKGRPIGWEIVRK